MGEHTKCCVVGGGPAGIVLGLLLARAGIAVTVLEKHADFLRDFRGDTVHPPTLRLLDELGLGEQFAALPRRELTEMRMRIAGREVVAADFSRVPGRHKYVAMVPQWDLLNLLASSAAREPSFTLRTRTEVTGLLRDNGRVTGVRYRSGDGDGELAADVVVGCDGRGSVVRHAAGLPARSFEVPMDVWQVRVPANGHEGTVFGIFGGGEAAVTMDRGDYHQVAYLIKKGDDARLRQRDIEWFRGRLGGLFGWDAASLSAIRSWEDVKLLEVTMDRLPRWYGEGVLCIGDAAHTMSPVGGVGINLAVQDAVATARLLTEPLRRGVPGIEDLAKVQKRRWLPMAMIQRMQLGEHEMLLRPALNGTLTKVPVPLRVLQWISPLHAVTARLGEIAVRPERAP